MSAVTLPIGPGPVPRRRHWEVLVVSTAVLFIAPLLEVRAAGRVGPLGLPGIVAPETCPARQWFGYTCPGCGLTRSFIHLAHGDLAASLRCNRVGWLLMALTAAQIPYRLLALSRFGYVLPAGVTRVTGALMIAILVGNWIVGFWI